MRILLVEPYHTGSHRDWAEGLVRASRHELRLISLPGRFWKWRMHGAALTAARRLREMVSSAWTPDLLLASDMLDLATFLGIVRDLIPDTPAILYMHENQLAYPQARPQPEWSESRKRRAAARDQHYPYLNLSSALAADAVWWNSAYNRDSFLAALPGFLGGFPDFRELDAPSVISARSRVMPLGLALQRLDPSRPAVREPGPPRILWNHRWERDKAPERFFDAIYALDAQGLDFELVVLGESFVKAPAVFEAAGDRLSRRILQLGYAEEAEDYAAWLWRSDLVVSTARHEFFGAAVCEAIYCGCRPLVPKRLAYPEILSEPGDAAWLYEPAELESRLADALRQISAQPRVVYDESLRRRIGAYDWAAIVPRYDEAFESLEASGRPPRLLY